MHLLLPAEASEPELCSEFGQCFPGVAVGIDHGLVCAEFPIEAGHSLPYLAFARQVLPNARSLRADSVRGWANELFQAVVGTVPEGHPWALHIEPHYRSATTHRMGARAWHTASRHSTAPARGSLAPVGPAPDSEPGRNRCRLIREALVDLLQKKRRHLLRNLRSESRPFTPDDSLVQLLLTAPDSGFVSVAIAPMPCEQHHVISPFPGGRVPFASDKSAPSRAFAKLVEAELRLGRGIRAGETCVDLGASPGSWTYIAANRGARVLAVDRSPLREDLMRSRDVQFQQGDAFRFKPERPVDWLLCDVIAAPDRSAGLLLQWLRAGWCRHFVLTVKLKDAPGVNVLAELKRELPALTRELFLLRLCANKKEVCAFGTALEKRPGG